MSAARCLAWVTISQIMILKVKQGSKAIPRSTMRLEHGIGMLDRCRGEGRSAWPKMRESHLEWEIGSCHRCDH